MVYCSLDLLSVFLSYVSFVLAEQMDVHEGGFRLRLNYLLGADDF
jgi:hypothetical protein